MSKVISEICGATGQGSDNTVQERRLQISGFVGPELCPHWSDGGPGRSRKRLQTGRVPTCVCCLLCGLYPEPWDLDAITTPIAEVRK